MKTVFDIYKDRYNKVEKAISKEIEKLDFLIKKSNNENRIKKTHTA
jgi:hypothetical protein